tara:strand:+ start:47 stop:175 length:129 start_codon:yes stop_codon:yes gene_type:complete
MWDIWTALLFLSIALPISLLVMGFLGWADSKQQEGKKNVGND